MRFLINTALLRRNKFLFALPQELASEMDWDFTHVLTAVSKLPVVDNVDNRKNNGPSTTGIGTYQSITAPYTHNNRPLSLTVTAKLLQSGDSTAAIINTAAAADTGRPGPLQSVNQRHSKPHLICLPWYGGKSTHTFKYLGSKLYGGWTIEGIDIFHTLKDFQKVVSSAAGSLYGYALVMRMLAERIRAAHRSGQRVGVVGISYGANILGAYITHGLELPDAIAPIEGGSIRRTTLETSYLGIPADPRLLAAYKQSPGFGPLQEPVRGRAALRSAAVINPSDTRVVGQEELWGKAGATLYVSGSHARALVKHRRAIRSFVREHLQSLLTD